MEDLEVRAHGRRDGDLHYVDGRDLERPSGLDPLDDLAQLVDGANELGLDGAVGKVADPAGDPGGPAVVLDMGPEADTLNDAPEAGADGLGFSQWGPHWGDEPDSRDAFHVKHGHCRWALQADAGHAI